MRSMSITAIVAAALLSGPMPSFGQTDDKGGPPSAPPAASAPSTVPAADQAASASKRHKRSNAYCQQQAKDKNLSGESKTQFMKACTAGKSTE